MVLVIARLGYVPSDAEFLALVKLLCVSKRPFVSKFVMMCTLLA
jgi:hypothetical protein